MTTETPEFGLSPSRRSTMITYAVLAWTYRLFLYSGIALIFYHRLTKAIGIAVFAVAIYSFIAKPIATEMAALMKLRRRLGWNRRMTTVAIAFGLALLWVILPLPRRQAVPATTIPRESQTVYTPGDGVIRRLSVNTGSTVHRGQTLLVIESDQLEHRAELARLEVQRIEIELAVIKTDDRQRALLPQKTGELARALAEQDRIRAAIESNRIQAEIDGLVCDWDESLRDGTPVGVNQTLGKIVDQGRPIVLAYVRHDLISDIAVNDRVSFTSNATPGRITGVVTNVDPVRTTFLEHLGLSSIAGGEIAVAPNARGRLEVLDSYYEVEVTLEEPVDTLRSGQTGKVWLRTTPRSRLAELFTSLYRTLIRESSF
jgi:putative peptide zinc metalloprotease protein